MDVILHNNCRLCWNTLNDSISVICDKNGITRYSFSEKKCKWFSSNLFTIANDFSKTQKTTKYDNLLEYMYEYELFDNGGAQHSNLVSVICMYIYINLSLLDFNKYECLIKSRMYREFSEVFLGNYDWSLPPNIVNEFIKIKDLLLLKQKSNEAIELILNFLSIIFEYLYTLVKITNDNETHRFDNFEIIYDCLCKILKNC